MRVGKFRYILLQLLAAFLILSQAKKYAKVLRSHCSVHDPVSIQNVTCWSKPVSRTVSLMNAGANITRLLNNVHLNIQVFKRSDLKFKHYFANITDDLCKFFAKSKGSSYLKLLTSIYLPYTNMNHTCPYFGYIFIKDLPLDSKNIPASWPPSEYRLDLLIIGDGNNLLTIQHFIEIKEEALHRRA